VADTSVEFYRKAPPDRGASSFVYPPSPANLQFFADALKAGCMVAIPTETVYGLAALALDENACRSIFSVKGRPLMDPLIVHVADLEMAGKLAVIPDQAIRLAGKFWPGPLTLILHKRAIVPDLVTAGKQTVAIRIPRHPVARTLLEKTEVPLAAPSANPFGYVSPTRAEHMATSFGPKVPFILDGGPCEVGLESTILDLSDPAKPVILRPGAISAEEIAGILGIPVESKQLMLHETEAATAPGTMLQHYSPRTRLVTFDAGGVPRPTATEAVVFLRRPIHNPRGPASSVFWLSEDGDMKQAARALFALLRQLDQKEFSRIYCELPAAGSPGIAGAIRDRLSRAAAR
jgi:L-threonylcarbamoyladenylate synthase